MLVLTRRVDEWIEIGDDIRIRLVKIDAERSQVRLGIDAPRELDIRRRGKNWNLEPRHHGGAGDGREATR